MIPFKPEGELFLTEENDKMLASVEKLEEARKKQEILEAKAVMCDPGHNLTVDLNGIKGVINREDAALGFLEGKIKDIAIISRVGRPVCFLVKEVHRYEDETYCLLSRSDAQKMCFEYLLQNIKSGDIIEGRVTKNEQFGTFLDIGCGLISFISIENISVSRIRHPSERFFEGEMIPVAVKDIDSENYRVTLTHKELLGTWEENAALFSSGGTVEGIVRSVEDYGIFVELAPNLTGLAESVSGVCAGDVVSVFIKAIIPEKMKVKLIIINVLKGVKKETKNIYFKKKGHIDVWRYTPPCCLKKNIETIF